jgi:hypothetical protein
VIRNLLIKDVLLTDVRGPASIFTLAESPIENFTLTNVTWSAAKGARTGYECTGWNGTKHAVGLFAMGGAKGLTPPLPTKGCSFLSASAPAL